MAQPVIAAPAVPPDQRPAAPSRRSRRHLAALGAILALSVAVRLPFLSLPLTVDEGSYAYVAFWWLHGATLYDQVWIDRPQGLFLAFAAMIRLLGDAPEALRLGVALLNLGTTALVYGAAAQVTGRSAALAAAAAYAVLSAHPRIEGVIANSEIITALPATLSLWLALTGARTLFAEGDGADRRRSLALLFAAGAAACGAFLVKQSGIVALPLALSVLLWEAYAARAARLRTAAARGTRRDAAAPPVLSHLPPAMGEKGWGRGGLALLAGFALLLALSLAHGLATAPAGYWEALAGHRIAYGSVLSYSLRQQAMAWLANFIGVWPAVTPFALLALWGLRFGPRPAAAWLWLVWNGAALTIGGEWWAHYYVQLAGPLALLAALGLRSLLAAQRPRTLPVHRPARALLLAGAVASAAAFTFDLAGYMARPGTPEQAARFSSEDRYRYGAAIAADLQRRVPAESGVYVAYEGAEILYQAQRISPVRHLFRIDLFAVPGAYEEMLDVLADPTRRPAAVAARPERIAGPLGPGDRRLAGLLASRYRPVAAFGPWQVYEATAP